MYVKRPFGDKMNASFDFIKENWKPILKYITYLLLPFSLVQALSLNSFMGEYMGLTLGIQQTGNDLNSILPMLPSLGLMYFFVILCYWIGSVLLLSLVYTLMKTYSTREGRLEGIMLGEFKPLLTHNLLQSLKATLFIGLLVLILILLIVLLAVLTPFTLLLTLPLFVAITVPLTLFVPIYLFEKVSLFEALRKAIRLGFATWGGVLLMGLVMGVIASILQGVMGTPWSVAFMVKNIFSMSDTGAAATVSVGYSFVLYLFAVLQCFGLYLGSVFSAVGIAYQYGHASEVVDSVSVESDINNFDKL